jgi:hypothetical protein
VSVDKTFGGGEGKTKSGARRETELGLTAFVSSLDFLLALRGGGSITWNFDVDMGCYYREEF